MECYKCQAELNKSDLCPGCKTNVKLYKSIIRQSNMHYNDGLLKAQVRDLSGAVISLRRSLKYNKMNIQARNLLGLIYFEMGETVDALSEWVISRNLKPEDNPAEHYLRTVQSSPNKLDAVNQTIKKYNQALTYCRQGSRDLAILQLKKVVSLNPKLVKGHQLLALLYMQEGKKDLALKSLRSALNIDGNNTTTLRYLQELGENVSREVSVKKSSSKEPRKKKEETISYQSGNETIIKPVNVKDYSPLGTILNLAIGIGMGVLITWFLVMPNAKQNAKSEANQAVLEASDTISGKNQTIKSLEAQIDTLQSEIDSLKNATDENQSALGIYEQLLIAYDALASDNISLAGDALALVTPETLSPGAKEIYDKVNTVVSEQYMEELYNAGYSAYTSYNYPVAIENLEKIVEIDEMYHDGDAMYYLAQSYRNTEEFEKANELYEKVVTLFPGTNKARNASNYL